MERECDHCAAALTVDLDGYWVDITNGRECLYGGPHTYLTTVNEGELP